MVESSFPPSRVGAAAVPDSIFLTRQRMIPLEMPDADSAVPQSPVSGNVPSARGLPLAGSGIGSIPRLEGMSPRISFIPSGCPQVHPAPCRPCCCAFWQSISLPLSWYLGDRDGTPVPESRCSGATRVGRLDASP